MYGESHLLSMLCPLGLSFNTHLRTHAEGSGRLVIQAFVGICKQKSIWKLSQTVEKVVLMPNAFHKYTY
jgi:hypothetical protein